MGVGIDEVGGDVLEPPGLRDSRDVAREPAVGSGVVRAQEGSPGLAEPQETGDGDMTRGPAARPRRRIRPIGRDEAAVDQDGEAGIATQRGKDPEAAAQLGDRLDQGLPVIEEDACGADMAIGGGLGGDARPVGGAGRKRRCGVDPGVDRGDQGELPAAPLDLPDAERDEQQGEQGQQGREEAALERGRAAPCRQLGGGRQGTWLGFWTFIGIRFTFRWYMIHTEPLIMMPTITIVNTKEIRLQPPSARVSRCRK